MYNYHPAGAATAKGSPSSRGGKQSSSGGSAGGGDGGGDSPENSPTTGPSSASPSSSSSSSPPPVGFVLHVVDLATNDDPRFQSFELSENPTLGEIYREKVSNGRSGAGRLLPGSSTPSSSGILGGGSGGGAGGASGALGGVLSRFDACLHFLAVPEKSTVIRSLADHDEFCRKHRLLFLKYFDVFNANRALWENQKGLEFLVDKKPPGGGGEGGGEDQERGTTTAGASSIGGGGEGLGSSPGSPVDHTIPEVLRDPNILCLDVMHVPANWKLVGITA